MKNVRALIEEIKNYPKFNGRYKKELSIKQFSKLDKYPNSTVLINEVFPLINDAYPGKFNLSVSEFLWSEMCKNKGFLINNNFFDYTALPEHSFWTITKNIRDEDYEKILDGSNQHLLLFHIASVGGFTITRLTEENREFYIKNFLDFLNKYLGSLEKLKVAYFDGGEIKKHEINRLFDKDVNKDLYEKFRKIHGFNLLPTKNETFLSLKVFGSPIFWGYRNEFFFQHNGKSLDLGTIECLPFIPEYKEANGSVFYKSIKEGDKGFIGSGVGLERLTMILENAKNIWDISLIKPLIKILRESSRNKEVEDRTLFIISEVLKVLHYILSERDGLTASELGNKHRREIISKFISGLIAGIVYADLLIDKTLIKKFVLLNKDLNQTDKRDLLVSDKIIERIFLLIEEQQRLYKTSPKHKEKIDSYIELIK